MGGMGCVLGKQKARLGGVGLGWKWFIKSAVYVCTMLRRARTGSQRRFATAILAIVGFERMEAEWFTAGVDADFSRAVQIQIFRRTGIGCNRKWWVEGSRPCEPEPAFDYTRST
jgi:hypothetical protein